MKKCAPHVFLKKKNKWYCKFVEHVISSPEIYLRCGFLHLLMQWPGCYIPLSKTKAILLFARQIEHFFIPLLLCICGFT